MYQNEIRNGLHEILYRDELKVILTRFYADVVTFGTTLWFTEILELSILSLRVSWSFVGI